MTSRIYIRFFEFLQLLWSFFLNLVQMLYAKFQNICYCVVVNFQAYLSQCIEKAVCGITYQNESTAHTAQQRHNDWLFTLFRCWSQRTLFHFYFRYGVIDIKFLLILISWKKTNILFGYWKHWTGFNSVPDSFQLKTLVSHEKRKCTKIGESCSNLEKT